MINNYPTKISRILGYFGKLTVKIHVSIKTNPNEPSDLFHNEFEFNNNVYLHLNPFVFITLERRTDNKNTWDKSGNIMLLQSNIHSFIRGIDEILENITIGKMFAAKNNGEIVLYKDEAIKNSVMIHLIHSNNTVKIMPGIVYDDNGTSYEGAIFYFNKIENDIPLTIEEMEGLRYLLTNIDLVTYSQLILNYFISYYKINKDNPVNKYKGSNKPTHHVLFDDNDDNLVKSNFSKTEENNIMDGL